MLFFILQSHQFPFVKLLTAVPTLRICTGFSLCCNTAPSHTIPARQGWAPQQVICSWFPGLKINSRSRNDADARGPYGVRSFEELRQPSNTRISSWEFSRVNPVSRWSQWEGFYFLSSKPAKFNLMSQFLIISLKGESKWLNFNQYLYQSTSVLWLGL